MAVWLWGKCRMLIETRMPIQAFTSSSVTGVHLGSGRVCCLCLAYRLVWLTISSNRKAGKNRRKKSQLVLICTQDSISTWYWSIKQSLGPCCAIIFHPSLCWFILLSIFWPRLVIIVVFRRIGSVGVYIVLRVTREIRFIRVQPLRLVISLIFHRFLVIKTLGCDRKKCNYILNNFENIAKYLLVTL